MYFSESQRDKMVTRMEEFSDSEDEDGNRRDEKSHRENKRPRLMEDGKGGVSRSSAKSQLLSRSSPLPPEPSPLTPVLTDETEQKGTRIYIAHYYFFIFLWAENVFIVFLLLVAFQLQLD